MFHYFPKRWPCYKNLKEIADEQILPTLIFLKTLLLSGSITILYTASGGSPTLTLTLRLQREPFGTLTCQREILESRIPYKLWLWWKSVWTSSHPEKLSTLQDYPSNICNRLDIYHQQNNSSILFYTASVAFGATNTNLSLYHIFIPHENFHVELDLCTGITECTSVATRINHVRTWLLQNLILESWLEPICHNSLENQEERFCCLTLTFISGDWSTHDGFSVHACICFSKSTSHAVDDPFSFRRTGFTEFTPSISLANLWSRDCVKKGRISSTFNKD